MDTSRWVDLNENGLKNMGTKVIDIVSGYIKHVKCDKNILPCVHWGITKYYFCPNTEMFWKGGDDIILHKNNVGLYAQAEDRKPDKYIPWNESVYGLLVIDGNEINKCFEWDFKIEKVYETVFGIDEACAKWLNGKFCDNPWMGSNDETIAYGIDHLGNTRCGTHVVDNVVGDDDDDNVMRDGARIRMILNVKEQTLEVYKIYSEEANDKTKFQLMQTVPGLKLRNRKFRMAVELGYAVVRLTKCLEFDTETNELLYCHFDEHYKYLNY